MKMRTRNTNPLRRRTSWWGMAAAGVLLALSGPLSAQVNLYTFAQSSGTYTPTSVGATQIIASNADDSNSAATAIGFSFGYNGAAFTQFVANSNGHIRLGASGPTSQYTPLSTVSNTNSIALLGRDGRSVNGVFVETTGAPGSQVCVIEFETQQLQYNNATSQMTCQIRLYEGTDVVEFVYGTGIQGNTYTPQVGLRGGTGATDFNNRTTTTDWSATTAGGASNATCTYAVGVFPASGQTYTWTPPPPPACPIPASVTATPVVFDGATINWGCLACTGSFIVEYGLTGFTPGLGATAGAGGTVITGAVSPQAITGLAASTGYQVYVRQDCSNTANGFSANSGVVAFTTPAPPPANDDCGNATPIGSCTGGPQTLVGQTTLNSTVDAIYSNCGAGGTNTTQRGVWYLYTGDDNAVTVNTCALGYDTRITVYSGSCGALVCEGGNDDACGLQSQVVFNANTGTDYYIYVHGYQAGAALSAVGNFTLSWTCSPLCVPVPGNDLCVNAQGLTMNAAATIGDNTCSGASVGNPSCESAFSTLPDVFYSFTSPAGGNIIVTINEITATNMGYAIYDACGGAEVACVGTVISGNPNSHALTGSTPYWIRVETLAGFEGTFDIAVSEPCQPAATRTSVPDCANNQFFIDVDVTSIGTSSDIDITTDFPGDTEPTGVGTGITQIGPYPSGTAVVITLVHDLGPPCDLSLASLSYTCPPANDECANAIPVSCNSVTNGTTVNATAEAPAPPACGTTYTAPGVWYTVAGFDGDMSASLCAGASYDTKMNVFSGTCGALVCVGGNDDFCGLVSQVSWTGSSAETYYILVQGFSSQTGTFTLSVTCGDTNPACTENGLDLEFQNDGNPGEVSWEVLDQTGSVVVISGPNPIPANSIGTQALCLPDGCYQLRVLDSGGDGMTTGGYELRETAGGRRIIDNTNNFSGGSVSAIAGGGTFCLPIGDIGLINFACDKLDWTDGKMLVCHRDAAVAAAWVSGGANNAQSSQTGYNWWIFDANGSYSYKRFRSHRNSDGYPAGTSTNPARADRPAHFKINSWTDGALTPHIPDNVMMNVRVRPFVNLTPTADWGPACQMMLDPARAACPLVWLQDDPSNTSDFSCGVTRDFGGTNSTANRITAKPPQIVPAVWSGQVRFQFRFRIPAEGVCIVRPVQSSPVLYMNWSAASGPQLQASKTYEVEVRVSKDFGATWCVDSPSPACDPSPVNTWGKTCSVTIGSVVSFQDESSSYMPAQGTSNLSMFPNPNNGNQLFLQLSEVAADVNTVSVDIYDLTGKRITARTIAVQDGFVNTAMELNGDIANGLYMVNITAGEKTYTERLVIQK